MTENFGEIEGSSKNSSQGNIFNNVKSWISDIIQNLISKINRPTTLETSHYDMKVNTSGEFEWSDSDTTEIDPYYKRLYLKHDNKVPSLRQSSDTVLQPGITEKADTGEHDYSAFEVPPPLPSKRYSSVN